VDYLAQHRQGTHHGWHAGGRRLEGGQAEALLDRGEGEQVGRGHARWQRMVGYKAEHDRHDAVLSGLAQSKAR
jgi:hypothetical protein